MSNEKTAIHPLRTTLIKRLIRNIIIGVLILFISLGIGMLGYHHFESMNWIDAYVNAAMILSGMGPLGPLQSVDGKLFAGTYAIFSGVIFLVLIAVIFSPIAHWLFIKFHLEENKLR